MVPIQAIFLFLLVMSQAPIPDPTGRPTTLPDISAVPPVSLILLTIFTSHALLVLIVWQRSRAAMQLLHNSAISAASVSVRVDRLMNAARWATIALVAIQLFGFHWGDTVTVLLSHTVLLKHFHLLQSLILLAPALLAWSLFWAAYYGMEKAMHDRSLPYRLAHRLPLHEMPTCSQFVWMNLRHNCYLFIPIGIVSVVESAGALLNSQWQYASLALSGLSMPLLLVFTPTLVVRFWDTVPLAGPLRQRLNALAARHHLRFSDILIWKTHHTVTNAGFFGLVPFGRYLLLTDSLLESLDDRQIEAVFAHEVGHGVHHHTWWYAGAVCAFAVLGVGGTDWLATFLPPTWHVFGYPLERDLIAGGILLCLTGLFLTFGFSLISRRFEHQADWFAARHMAEALETGTIQKVPLDSFLSETPTAHESMTLEEYANPAAPPAAAPVIPATPTPPLPMPAAHSATSAAHAPYLRLGAVLFSQTLDALVELTHRSRTKGGWMHPSPERRIDLLLELADSPGAAAAFNTRMILIRLGIVVALAASAAVIVLPEIWPYISR